MRQRHVFRPCRLMNETISAATLAATWMAARLLSRLDCGCCIIFVVLATTAVDKFRKVAKQAKHGWQPRRHRRSRQQHILIDEHHGHNEDHNVEAVSQRTTGPVVAQPTARLEAGQVPAEAGSRQVQVVGGSCSDGQLDEHRELELVRLHIARLCGVVAPRQRAQGSRAVGDHGRRRG